MKEILLKDREMEKDERLKEGEREEETKERTGRRKEREVLKIPIGW